MWRLYVHAMFIVLITGCSSEQSDIAMSEIEVIVEYANANWYENGRFVRRSGFVQNGEFVEAPPNGADSVVDLGNKYVVPGFAEAHHHTVLCDAERIEQFLDGWAIDQDRSDDNPPRRR